MTCNAEGWKENARHGEWGAEEREARGQGADKTVLGEIERG